MRRVFYSAGMANQRLPDLPRQARPRGRARRQAGLALRRPGGLRRLDARQDRLRAVPHRGEPVAHAALRDDHQRRSIAASVMRRRSSSTRSASTARSPRKNDPDAPGCLDCHSHARHQSEERAGSRRPSRATSRRSARAATARARRRRCASTARRAGHRRQLRRLDPRPGPDRERPGRHRDLRQLPLVARRAAARRSRARRSTGPTCPTTCGKCHHGVEETFAKSIHATGEAEERRAAAGLRGLPHLAQSSRADSPGFRTQMLEPVRRLPQGAGRDLLRDLPRQGLAARRRRRGQVLRLPRHAQHPEADRPGLDPVARQRRRDLRQVPRRGRTAASPAT